jgi:dTDP-4-dehydrorhamnose 3,5-epimerase
MRIVETELSGVFVVEADLITDERGLFARTYSQDVFAEHGLHGDFVQCNVSRNTKAGTVRGLHFQWAPHGEVKLVRCVTGSIFDVAVDLRRNSPSFGRWFGTVLDGASARALYIPTGFAHGFQSLTDDAEVFYQMSTVYQASHTGGVRWDDPEIGIAWPLPQPSVISARDQALPLLRDLGEGPM